MRGKTKWLFGLVALCLVSAIAASLLTAVFFIRGYFRQSLIWQSGTTADNITESTTGSLAAVTTRKPTTRVTLSTTRPTTVQPTVSTTTEPTKPEHQAAWQLSLWQVQEQIETYI